MLPQPRRNPPGDFVAKLETIDEIMERTLQVNSLSGVDLRA